jgi:hypothetical protein
LIGSYHKASLENDSNHILSIYENSKEKFDHAFEYLSEGISKNESILLITDELSEEDVLKIMEKKYLNLNVPRLRNEGIITIESTSRWYYSDNSVNIEKIKSKWKIAVDDTLSTKSSLSSNSSSSKGLRVFADVKAFFRADKLENNKEINYVDELIKYETSLEKRFPFPMNAICAYESEDIAGLDKNQLQILMQHHGLVHADNYNELVNPSPNSHIILLYEDQTDLDSAIAEYINIGLIKGQLCVHASVHLNNTGYLQNFLSKIIDYEENLEKGNLVLVDLAEFYIDAITENLQSFDKLKDDLVGRVKDNPDRIDKHVRLTADCATFLLKNKHFEQSINLEKWWHQKPFEGSYVCPYPKSLLNQIPFNYYLFKLFHSHDVVIDTNKNIPLDYVKNEEHRTKLISGVADKAMRVSTSKSSELTDDPFKTIQKIVKG